MKNKHIGILLQLIFLAGIFPQQYFISLHDHEHKKSNTTHEETGFYEKLHDCSDQLNYLSIQTDLCHPSEIHSYQLKSFYPCYLQRGIISRDLISAEVRAPPLRY